MEQDVLFAVQDTENIEKKEDTQELQTEKYLLFTSAQLLFGVPSEYVVEIITNYTITKLPLVPDYVRGIINLRGQIIPIVDIRTLLGHEGENDQCTIILNIDGTMVGILIDSVLKMMDVDTTSIRPDPGQNAESLVSGMCSLPDGQTMLTFDCAKILTHS